MLDVFRVLKAINIKEHLVMGFFWGQNMTFTEENLLKNHMSIPLALVVSLFMLLGSLFH